MREILFRGMSKVHDKWVEGSYIELPVSRFVAPEFKSKHRVVCENSFSYIITLNSEQYNPESIKGAMYEVIPETVGQYTGLKDKNGNQIFEGDIVEGYFDDKKIRGYIFYGSDAKFFVRRNGLYGIELNNAEDWIEVIGNIHDNPELLEVEICKQ